MPFNEKIKIMKYVIVLLVTVTIGMYSCDPFYDCEEVDSLSVFDDLRNIDSIQYYASKVLLDERAFDSLYSGMKLFINNEADYDALKQKADDNDCTECVFPNIDFTNRTLIGQYFVMGCDQYAEQRFVVTSDSTYAFYSKFINPQRCAISNCANFTFNWMLVPKVESIDKVEYFNGDFYFDCDC